MDEFDPENWNFKMAKASDLYLTGEGGLVGKYRQAGIPAYYFQMDVADANIETFVPKTHKYKYDVTFTGSLIGKGHRREWLQEINKKFPVRVFSWNWEEWRKLDFDASPAIYGKDYNKVISQSKVVLGFNVEPNCWGYWSNRIGKVLLAGGFLLQEYAPGMELFLQDGVNFFSTPDEAIQKIGYYLKNEGEREDTRKVGRLSLSWKFSSAYKAKQLTTLIERYLTNGKDWVV
jgi:spore maturation protein CgeB